MVDKKDLIEEYKRQQRVKKDHGIVDFSGFYKRPPEPTEAERNAELLKALFGLQNHAYKEPEEVRNKPFELTEEQRQGNFYIQNNLININYYPLDFDRGTMAVKKTKEFLFMKKKLEEKLRLKYPRNSLTLDQKIIMNPMIIPYKSPRFMLTSAASYIDIKIDRREYSGILVPYEDLATMAYQFNDLVAEKVLASGAMKAVTQPKENGNFTEILIREVRTYFN